MNAPLVPVTLAFLAGILVGTPAWLPPWCLAIVGLVSAGVALWRWRRFRCGVLAALLLWSCLGALRVEAWRAHPEERLSAALPEDPQPVRLHGVLVTDPVELFEPADSDAVVGVIRLLHVRTAQGWRPVTGRLRATFQNTGSDPNREHSRLSRLGSDPALRYGDEVLADGEWSQVPAAGNPGQYDRRSSLARERIHGLLRIRPFHGVATLRRHQAQPWLEAVFRLRRRWEQLIETSSPPLEAGLLRSLLLGERGPLDQRLKDAFVETGTIHLVARELRRNAQDTLASNLTI